MVTYFGDEVQRAQMSPGERVLMAPALAWSQCLCMLNLDNDWVLEYCGGPRGWKLGARCILCHDWICRLDRHGQWLLGIPLVRKHGRAHLMDLGIERLTALISAFTIAANEHPADVIATVLGYDGEDTTAKKTFWKSIRRPG